METFLTLEINEGSVVEVRTYAAWNWAALLILGKDLLWISLTSKKMLDKYLFDFSFACLIRRVEFPKRSMDLQLAWIPLYGFKAVTLGMQCRAVVKHTQNTAVHTYMPD